jgi:hypothetical protein
LLHYGYTPDYLENYLKKVMVNYAAYVVLDGLSIKTIAIFKDEATFKVQVLLNKYDRQKEREIRRELNTAIMKLSEKREQEQSAEVTRTGNGVN